MTSAETRVAQKKQKRKPVIQLDDDEAIEAATMSRAIAKHNEKVLKRKRAEEEEDLEIEEPGEEIDMKNFKVRDTCLLLTYKTHIDKDEYTDWFHSKKAETKFLRLAHENGDKYNKYPHTHVLISLTKQPNWRDCRVLDFKEIHPHWKRISGGTRSLHWKNCLKYLAKEDPDNADLKQKEQVDVLEVVERCKTEAEFLREMTQLDPKTPTKTVSLLSFYNKIKGDQVKRRRIEQRKQMVQKTPVDRPWQQAILKKIDSPVHPRWMTWVWDPQGDTGKSTLTRYLKAMRPEDCLCLDLTNDARSVGTFLCKRINQEGWEGKAVILDVAASVNPNSQETFRYIEGIKNGDVTSDKYLPEEIFIPEPPHVIVLTNRAPEVTTKDLMDRWGDIHEIVGTDLIHRPKQHFIDNHFY